MSDSENNVPQAAEGGFFSDGAALVTDTAHGALDLAQKIRQRWENGEPLVSEQDLGGVRRAIDFVLQDIPHDYADPDSDPAAGMTGRGPSSHVEGGVVSGMMDVLRSGAQDLRDGTAGIRFGGDMGANVPEGFRDAAEMLRTMIAGPNTTVTADSGAAGYLAGVQAVVTGVHSVEQQLPAPGAVVQPPGGPQ